MERYWPLPRLGSQPRSRSGFAGVDPGEGEGPSIPWSHLFPLAKNWRAMGICYALWVGSLLYSHWTSTRIESGWIWASVFSAPLLHVTAFALFAPLPWILPSRLRSPWNFVLGFVLSIIGCELISALLPLIDGWLFTQAQIKFDGAKLMLIYTGLVGPAMMVVGGLVAARARSEELRQASETEAQIAKNQLLQSQVHPHVLFNALNGLVELVHKDPEAAETAIRHLSDLLRRLLLASEHSRLPLGEERKIISDFLALEAIRLGSRLRVAWEWEEALDAIELPPLLLQPLVENAIKHGIAPSIPGGELIVRGRAEGGAISLEVWNSGVPFCEGEKGAGIGLRNLRSRLALNFGPGASLSLGASGQGTLACLRFAATLVEFPHGSTESPSRR